MGYCISQVCEKFGIDSEAGALAAIRQLCSGDEKFAWVVSADVLKATTLDAAMVAWGWRLDRAETAGDSVLNNIGDDVPGAVNGIVCHNEKLGDDDRLFAAIAPHVTPGSFIEMRGEDDAHWRWVFNGTSCREVAAVVTWPEQLDETAQLLDILGPAILLELLRSLAEQLRKDNYIDRGAAIRLVKLVEAILRKEQAKD